MEEIKSQHQNNGLTIIIDNIEFTLIYKVTTYETGIYEEIYKSPPIKDETSRIVKIKSINLSNRNEEFFWFIFHLASWVYGVFYVMKV